MVRPPWFKTLPAKAMVTLALHAEKEKNQVKLLLTTCMLQFNILQASFILLDLCVTVGAPLCYLVCELLGLSILVHPNIKPSSLHPLTNVFTAGRLMSLQTHTHSAESALF